MNLGTSAHLGWIAPAVGLALVVLGLALVCCRHRHPIKPLPPPLLTPIEAMNDVLVDAGWRRLPDGSQVRIINDEIVEQPRAQPLLWTRRMIDGLERVKRRSSGEIETESYIAAMAPIPDVYDALISLQAVSGFMRRDFEAHLANVRGSMLSMPDGAGLTLQGIVWHGMAHYQRETLARNPASVVGGVLWLHRATKFIVMFMRGLADGQASARAAQHAYGGLRPYHNMLTAAFVGRALALCPDRRRILEKLQLASEAHALRELRELLALTEPLVAEIERSLESMDANFPDRV